MPIYYTKNKRLVAWYKKEPIKKYRPIISEKLIKKFGKNSLKSQEITDVLFYLLEWYKDRFLEILQNENELTFYQGLFLLHEFSCSIHQENPNTSPIKEMSFIDFAMYRRILKLCLEQACDLKLVSKEEASQEYLKSKENIIDELLYLGDFIYMFSNLLAQHQIIEDSIELKFTPENQYYIDYKHHYGILIKELSNSYLSHIDEAVVGENDFEELISALKECLDINYHDAVSTIQAIHNHFEAGKFALDEWLIYPKNLENLFGIPYEKGKIFFEGLTLSKNNKMSLLDAVYRPHNLNKYLYRPFLVWNVDGKDLTFVGDRSFITSMFSLASNSFGWNKYPKEWRNKKFLSFIKRKVIKNDKILEDKAEQILKSNSILYDRNLTHLKKWNGQHLDIENENCGEIDFLFILNDKIYLADSKHQIARYDMNNFKNDYSYFTLGKKPYNKTIKRKEKYLLNKINDVEEHFQVLLNDKTFKIKISKIEPIFIINTPTFIMYNNEIRIYTLKSFRELVSNCFVDKTYNLIIDSEHTQKLMSINYPYFKKPDYIVFDYDKGFI